jgi:hypothetical protein
VEGRGSEDSCQRLIVVLGVLQFGAVELCFHSEVEEGFGDVFDVVVVDCCGDDVWSLG